MAQGAAAMTALGSLAVAIVAVGVILSSGAEVQSDILADQTAGSYAANITTQALENTEKVSDKTALVTTVAVAVLVIALIVGGFAAIGFMRG